MRRVFVLMVGVLLVSGGSSVAAFTAHRVSTKRFAFDVYDHTGDGLQVGTDPVIGAVRVIANPEGKPRLRVAVTVVHAVPRCRLGVELVRDFANRNGGLDQLGHVGRFPRLGYTKVLGSFRTNKRGEGGLIANFRVGRGRADERVFGHIDLESVAESGCKRSDGTALELNDYGAAPDPALRRPLTFFE